MPDQMQADVADVLLVRGTTTTAGTPADQLADVVTYAETLTIDASGAWDCATVPLVVDQTGARVEGFLLRAAIGCDGYDAREVTLGSDDGTWTRMWLSRDGRALVVALTEDGRAGAEIPREVFDGLRMLRKIRMWPPIASGA